MSKEVILFNSAYLHVLFTSFITPTLISFHITMFIKVNFLFLIPFLIHFILVITIPFKDLSFVVINKIFMFIDLKALHIIIILIVSFVIFIIHLYFYSVISTALFLRLLILI